MKCENLDIWKRSASLSADIYQNMHRCNDFGLKDQVTRSGLSIPSNIAEGIERSSDKDTIRFPDIARASSAELQTQIYIGMKIAYIEKSVGSEWIKELKQISKMINSLISTIRNSND